MSTNGHNPIEELPHIDVIVRLYPTLAGKVEVTAPAQLAPFQVLGILDEAKSVYYDAVKQMRADSRISLANGPLPKIAS